MGKKDVYKRQGYDHIEEEEKAVMRSREEDVMSRIGLQRD